MKKILIPIALTILISSSGSLANSINNTVENTATGKVDQKAGSVMSDAMETEFGNGHNSSMQNNSNSSARESAAVSSQQGSPQQLGAYQNYDFKPGDTIIFSDDFTADQDGEFPAHWNLEGGQGVVNVVDGGPAFLLTEGNMAIVSPRMKTNSYLTDPFTVEFDYQANGGYSDPVVIFLDADNTSHYLQFGHQLSTLKFSNDLTGSVVGSDDNYNGKWHHGAIIFKDGQLKAYLDNTRALVVPQCGFVPVSLQIGGVAMDSHPIIFKNVRIASGGNANTIGALLTNGKFVTHGITFDVGKANLQPQSMGVLNDVAKFLKSNTSINMEIDGHTDNTGSASANVTLSQQRANAVEAQLISMGIDASRLTTKGFGATMPIASNDTPEGQANNRRVEFVKM